MVPSGSSVRALRRVEGGELPGEPPSVVVDVLVIGAGAAGLVAAIAAHDAGARVAVLEKSARFHGNTAMSAGSIPGAGTRFQAQAGIDDDPQRFVDDLERTAGEQDAPLLVRTLARISAPLIEWLVDAAGVDMQLVTQYRHVGHSTHRLHAPPSRRGSDLHAALLRAVHSRDIDLAFGNPVIDLLHDDDGRVGGAVACTIGTPGGTDRTGAAPTYTIAARAVVLATNGFGANRELLAAHCQGATHLHYAGAPGSTGEALRWGLALGAGLANMRSFQGHGSYCLAFGAPATWTVVEYGGVIIDSRGRRFANEAVGYSAFAESSRAGHAPLWLLFDTRIRDRVAHGQREFADLVAHGLVREAPDAVALAARIGVPLPALMQTLHERDALRVGGSDSDALGRPLGSDHAVVPPYCALEITPALFHTQGGLCVNERAAVCRPDGTPIAGLFAAGGAAAGISGRQGASGYVSGNGLLAACGLGLLAGRAAAEDRFVSNEGEAHVEKATH